MGKKKILLIQYLLKSLAPFAIGSSCYLLKGLYFNLFQQNTANSIFNSLAMKQGLSETQQNDEASFLIMITECLTWLQEASFGAYKGYFAFLFTMLLLDMVIRINYQGVQWASSGSKLPISNEEIASRRSSFSDGLEKNMMTLKNLLMTIFCYTLIFFVFKTTRTSFVHENGQIDTLKNPRMTLEEDFSHFDAVRILEQQAVFHEDQLSLKSPPLAKSPEKISLSMGNIISSLNLDVTAMALSKDRKVAFATVNHYGTLKIIDISDLQAPVVISSLGLEVSGYTFQIKSLALSSDERVLYISNFRDLEIVDVADLESPKLLSFTSSEILTDYNTPQVTRYCQTSLALDENTKTLFVGGLGFQVFNVSNPLKPVILRAEKNPLDEEKKHSRIDVHLSQDGKALFVANGTLDVYNISNPRDLKKINSFPTESSARSMYFPQDLNSKTVFLIGASVNQNVILEEMDISNYNEIKVAHRTYNLEYNSTFNARILAISPCRTKFFIFIDNDIQGFDLLIFDSFKNTAIPNKKNLINNTFSMNFLPDGKTLLTGSNEQFMVIALFLDYPNQKTFSQSLNDPIGNFSLASSCSKIHLSSDGKNSLCCKKG